MNTLIPTLKRRSNVVSEFDTWNNLSSWIDDVINHNLSNTAVSNFNKGITLPAVNLIEQDNHFTIEMAVPGFKKEDFNINVDNNVLSISSEVKTEDSERNETYTRREFGYASFKRSFKLPKTVDAEAIKATYTDGILNLTLPKLEEAKKKPLQQIEIS